MSFLKFLFRKRFDFFYGWEKRAYDQQLEQTRTAAHRPGLDFRVF